jgi:hypothetical protein
MLTRSLRKNDEAGDDESRDDRRSDRTAQRQFAIADGLVEEIANCRSKRSRENKGGPEQEDPRNVRPDIGHGQQRQAGGEDERAAS